MPTGYFAFGQGGKGGGISISISDEGFRKDSARKHLSQPGVLQRAVSSNQPPTGMNQFALLGFRASRFTRATYLMRPATAVRGIAMLVIITPPFASSTRVPGQGWKRNDTKSRVDLPYSTPAHQRTSSPTGQTRFALVQSNAEQDQGHDKRRARPWA